jgi:hypothetical protein
MRVKKLSALFAAAVLALVVAACGDNAATPAPAAESPAPVVESPALVVESPAA